MNNKDLRIVYMGTPDFAVESLRALVEGGYNVVGVVTMPDKPMGRGYKIQPSPVKIFAEQHQIKVLQPEKLKDETFLDELRNLHADLQIVVAFRMLPEVVWNMPPLGTINLHASLLPQYRGAAPINWAIINGEKETGITTFFLKHEIDTGNIIFQEKIAIDDNDNAEIVHDKLMVLGAKLVTKTVDNIAAGTVVPQPQTICETQKAAPKIFKETCKINWNTSCETIHDFVRGLSPYPTAWCELQTADGIPLNLKIYEVATNETPHTEKIGTIVCDGKKSLRVACADGFVEILSLQLAGKKRMTTPELLRGFTLTSEYKMR